MGTVEVGMCSRGPPRKNVLLVVLEAGRKGVQAQRPVGNQSKKSEGCCGPLRAHRDHGGLAGWAAEVLASQWMRFLSGS